MRSEGKLCSRSHYAVGTNSVQELIPTSPVTCEVTEDQFHSAADPKHPSQKDNHRG